MTVAELAKAAGVNPQTVRFYERKGLLPEPHRWPDSGYRDYDEEALRRLRFIRSAKEVGFSLREIKELLDFRLLPRESCGEVKQLIGEKLADLDRRMKELTRIQSGLASLLAACDARGEPKNCPALWTLDL